MIELGKTYQANIIRPVSSGLLITIPDYSVTEIVRWREVSHETISRKPETSYKAGDIVLVKVFDRVVTYGDVIGEGIKIRYLLSIRLAQSDPWDDINKSLNWSPGSRNVYSMEINRVTARNAHGEVKSGVSAIVGLNELYDYFSKRIIPTNMPLMPKRCDTLKGYITKINIEKRIVELDTIRYMEDIRTNQSPEIAILEPPHTHKASYYKKSQTISSILIVDDEPFLVESLDKSLSNEGYIVHKASGVHAVNQAKRILDNNIIDLCLLDIKLPNSKAGIELAQYISDHFPRTRTILSTAYDDFLSDYPKELLNTVHCTDYLKKPYKIEELLDILAEAEERDSLNANKFFLESQVSLKKTDEKVTGPLQPELYSEIKALYFVTGAHAAALFEIHRVTQEVTMLVSIGIDYKMSSASKTWLNMSPIRDCAIDNEVVLTYDANDPREIGKHRNLKKLFDYCRCVGVPVKTPGDFARCVFAFSSSTFKDLGTRYMVEASAARLERIFIEHVYQQQSLRQKSEATAGITYAILGHELKNKLTTLGSIMHTLAQATADRNHFFSDENIRQIKIAGEMVERMHAITTIFKRLAEKRKIEKINVHTTIAKAQQDIGLYTNSEGIQARFLIKNAKNLPQISASEWSLVQVFFNVLINAVQHTMLFWNEAIPYIIVETGIEESYERNFVFVDISDNGPGIHTIDFDKIYEPMVTTRPDGAGLGLYLCRSVLNEIGGRIFVKESTLYCGSTFRILIPID
jgi:signal transduction histidine kinase/DNA-binding LytR/AlgR family response regulator